MAYVHTDALFPNRAPQHWPPPQAVTPAYMQPGINWKALAWTAVGLGVIALLANASEPAPQRRCGTCGKLGHDTRKCSQNPAKRVRLRLVKTGRCSCCKRRFQRTEAHHYAGPADGTRGREMCGTCHLICGHAGDYRNMAVNPRYCRL